MKALIRFVSEPTLTPFEAGVIAVGSFVLALGVLSAVL